MVLEGVISGFIAKFARKFIKNFDGKLFELSITKGDINLVGLQLNEEYLESYNLPFVIKGGFISKVEIKIPWTALKTKPTIVNVDKVLLLMGSQTNANEFMKRARQAVQRVKKAHAVAIQELKEKKKSKQSSKPFQPGMISSILMNMELKITNVHIRFEDDFSNLWHPWAAGVTLESLIIATQPGAKGDQDLFAFKRIDINLLSVYWDPDTASRPFGTNSAADMLTVLMPRHHTSSSGSHIPHHAYIIKPISFGLEAAVKKTSKLPAVDVKINVLTKLDLRVEKKQVDDLMAFVGYCKNYGQYRACYKYRPTMSVFRDPRGWWFYAIRCVLHYVITCNPKFVWKQVVRLAVRRDRYVQAYYLQILGRGDLEDVLQRLEDEISPKDVSRFRKQVEDVLTKAGNVLKVDTDFNIALASYPEKRTDNIHFDTDIYGDEQSKILSGLSEEARQRIGTKKAMLLTPEKNPLRIRVELNFHETGLVLTDSRQFDLCVGTLAQTKLILQDREHSFRVDLAIGNADVLLQDYGATSQMVARQPPTPGDPISEAWSETPLVTVTLEKIKGPDEPSADGIDAREWAALLAVAPIDIAIYEPLYLDLIHLFRRRFWPIRWKHFPQTMSSAFMESARTQDHAFKVILGGIRFRQLRERGLFRLLFQPEGTITVPGMEAVYASRDYPSVFGFLRATVSAADGGLSLPKFAPNAPGIGGTYYEAEDRYNSAPAQFYPGTAANYPADFAMYAVGSRSAEVERLQQQLEQERLQRNQEAAAYQDRLRELEAMIAGMGGSMAGPAPYQSQNQNGVNYAPMAAPVPPPQQQPPSNNGPVVVAGYLEKCPNSFFRMYRRRWAALEDGYLSFYKSKEDWVASKQSWVEQYLLPSIRTVKHEGPENEDSCLLLSTMVDNETQEYYLRYENAAVAGHWLRCFASWSVVVYSKFVSIGSNPFPSSNQNAPANESPYVPQPAPNRPYPDGTSGPLRNVPPPASMPYEPPPPQYAYEPPPPLQSRHISYDSVTMPSQQAYRTTSGQYDPPGPVPLSRQPSDVYGSFKTKPVSAIPPARMPSYSSIDAANIDYGARQAPGPGPMGASYRPVPEPSFVQQQNEYRQSEFNKPTNQKPGMAPSATRARSVSVGSYSSRYNESQDANVKSKLKKFWQELTGSDDAPPSPSGQASPGHTNEFTIQKPRADAAEYVPPAAAMRASAARASIAGTTQVSAVSSTRRTVSGKDLKSAGADEFLGRGSRSNTVDFGTGAAFGTSPAQSHSSTRMNILDQGPGWSANSGPSRGQSSIYGRPGSQGSFGQRM